MGANDGAMEVGALEGRALVGTAEGAGKEGPAVGAGVGDDEGIFINAAVLLRLYIYPSSDASLIIAYTYCPLSEVETPDQA